MQARCHPCPSANPCISIRLRATLRPLTRAGRPQGRSGVHRRGHRPPDPPEYEPPTPPDASSPAEIRIAVAERSRGHTPSRRLGHAATISFHPLEDSGWTGDRGDPGRHQTRDRLGPPGHSRRRGQSQAGHDRRVRVPQPDRGTDRAGDELPRLPHPCRRGVRAHWRVTCSERRSFDPDQLYQFKIDNDGDAKEDRVIQVTFSGSGPSQSLAVMIGV